MLKNETHQFTPVGIEKSPDDSSSLTVRVADGREELLAAYQLIYSRYVEKGYVEARPGGIVYQPRFGLASSRTLIAVTDQKGIVGTMTVAGDNFVGLQLEEIYRAEVDGLRNEGRSVAEVTCLCVDEEAQISGKKVFTALTKFAIHHAYLRKYDDLLLAIHPRHYRIYWHTFRAYPIGPCREYESVGGNLALCCRINLHNLEENMTPRIRQAYFGEVQPLAYYDGPQIGAADHSEFCRMLSIPASTATIDGEKRRQAA